MKDFNPAPGFAVRKISGVDAALLKIGSRPCEPAQDIAQIACHLEKCPAAVSSYLTAFHYLAGFAREEFGGFAMSRTPCVPNSPFISEPRRLNRHLT